MRQRMNLERVPIPQERDTLQTKNARWYFENVANNANKAMRPYRCAISIVDSNQRARYCVVVFRTNCASDATRRYSRAMSCVDFKKRFTVSD